LVIDPFDEQLASWTKWASSRANANHAEAKLDVCHYTAGFYNRECSHSVSGNPPPGVQERGMAEEGHIVVSEIT